MSSSVSLKERHVYCIYEEIKFKYVINGKIYVITRPIISQSNISINSSEEYEIRRLTDFEALNCEMFGQDVETKFLLRKKGLCRPVGIRINDL